MAVKCDQCWKKEFKDQWGSVTEEGIEGPVGFSDRRNSRTSGVQFFMKELKDQWGSVTEEGIEGPVGFSDGRRN